MDDDVDLAGASGGRFGTAEDDKGPILPAQPVDLGSAQSCLLQRGDDFGIGIRAPGEDLETLGVPDRGSRRQEG